MVATSITDLALSFSLLLVNSASRDQRPGPAMSKKMTTITCAYSERISCKTAHNPICGGTGGNGSGEVPKYIEIFVDNIATIISMIKGTAINRVRKPAI